MANMKIDSDRRPSTTTAPLSFLVGALLTGRAPFIMGFYEGRATYIGKIKLEFLEKIRDDIKFESVEDLKKQIENDIKKVQEIKL